MTAVTIVVDDVLHRAEGSVVRLSLGEQFVELSLRAVGPAAVNSAIATVTELVEAGRTLDAAAQAATDVSTEIAGRTERRWLADGSLLLIDTAGGAPEEVRASLRALADIGRTGLRTVAVLGALRVDERDRLEAHDALGRIVVRLDIAQLVVIGHDARHLYMAASLEGSWNGESVFFNEATSAYDFVRATTGPNTVILISGGAEGDELVELADRLQETPA